MARIRAAVVWLLLVPALLALLSPRAAADPPADSTLRMAERLADLQRDLPLSPYDSDGQARLLAARLKAGGNLQDLFLYAIESLRAAETERAIALFERLEGIATKARGGGGGPSPTQLRLLEEFHAVAWLRLGEQQNCIQDHSADSCLLPIRDAGVHRLKQPSREAIRRYTALLEQFPEDVGYRWLLNIAYMTVGEWPEGVPARWRIRPRCIPRTTSRWCASGTWPRPPAWPTWACPAAWSWMISTVTGAWT